jgi:uncharacterized protein (DUF1501 family)
MSKSTDLSQAGRSLLDRRSFLSQGSTGLSCIALASLLGGNDLLGASMEKPRLSHFSPKAKNVVVIFCAGAVSQLETFDYKPELAKRHDDPLPPSLPSVTFQNASGNLAAPHFAFRPRGQCGKMVSDLLPHLGGLVDEMSFIHSLTSKTNTHGPGENFLSTGNINDGFPSIGAWVTYALGSANDNLPAFVAIPDPRGVPQASINNWGPGFLPSVFQGTPFSAAKPIRNLKAPSTVSPASDLAARDLLKRYNDAHLARFPGDSDLAARIASYELAAKMQLSVPEVSDLSTESASTLKQYGADDPSNTVKAGYAKNCILARRLLERGVRFVQLFNGAYASGGKLNWDGHKDLKKQYTNHAEIMDQPTAALLVDLKQRGMLEDTLFVWCTEFGRMPMFQKGASGRDHNPNGFTAWLAGAGVKAPFSYGRTDELGYKAIENVSSLYDLNATILHLLGLNHEALTVHHNGFERRLTDVHGHVLHEMLT